MGFFHPHGELHILSPGKAVSCPGASSHALNTYLTLHTFTGDDDAIDWQCQILTVPTVLQGSIIDHVSLCL